MFCRLFEILGLEAGGFSAADVSGIISVAAPEAESDPGVVGLRFIFCMAKEFMVLMFYFFFH